jgi:hypothetical protein
VDGDSTILALARTLFILVVLTLGACRAGTPPTADRPAPATVAPPIGPAVAQVVCINFDTMKLSTAGAGRHDFVNDFLSDWWYSRKTVAQIVMRLKWEAMERVAV